MSKTFISEGVWVVGKVMEYKLELFGHTVYGEEQIIWEKRIRPGCIPGKGSTGRQKLAKSP